MHVTTQNTPTNRRYSWNLVLLPQDFSQLVRFSNRTIPSDCTLRTDDFFMRTAKTRWCTLILLVLSRLICIILYQYDYKSRSVWFSTCLFWYVTWKVSKMMWLLWPKLWFFENVKNRFMNLSYLSILRKSKVSGTVWNSALICIAIIKRLIEPRQANLCLRAFRHDKF